jgi:ferredoxin
MVQTVDKHPTSDLKAFFQATQHVQEKERAEVGISRRGRKMTFVVEARNTKTLGFAQMEAAQPIRPGALSPHRSRGRPCTHCHIIMLTGGQLPTDAGDILPNPPPITKDAVAPHGNRGQCATCHVVR